MFPVSEHFNSPCQLLPKSNNSANLEPQHRKQPCLHHPSTKATSSWPQGSFLAIHARRAKELHSGYQTSDGWNECLWDWSPVRLWASWTVVARSWLLLVRASHTCAANDRGGVLCLSWDVVSMPRPRFWSMTTGHVVAGSFRASIKMRAAYRGAPYSHESWASGMTASGKSVNSSFCLRRCRALSGIAILYGFMSDMAVNHL